MDLHMDERALNLVPMVVEQTARGERAPRVSPYYQSGSAIEPPCKSRVAGANTLPGTSRRPPSLVEV